MTPEYPQWPGLPLRFESRRTNPREVPDRHSQLEELLGHVRRCERWARIDDRIDLSWRLDGNR